MPEPLPADDLIARCRRVYAECETYADEGEQTETFEVVPAPRRPFPTWRTVFRTRWKRPDRLRLDIHRDALGPEDPARQCALWSTPSGLATWAGAVAVRESSSHRDSMFAISSIIKRTSLLTDLLRASESSPRLAEDANTEHVELAGQLCMAMDVIAKEPHFLPERFRVWIDLEDALIRRIDSAHEARPISGESGVTEMNARAVERTLFRPRLNVPIDDAEFEFMPPEGP